MMRQGLLPGVITYNALISACEKGALPQRALELFGRMLNQGLLPNVITYFALVKDCERGTLAQRAMQLLEAMLHQSLLPNVIPYSDLISACNQQRYTAAESLAARGGNAAPRPPARRDHLRRFG